MFELYLLTFNCARELADPQFLAPSFFDALPKAAPLPDLVVVSLQEVAPIAYSFLGGSYLKPYFDRITTTVQLAADLYSHGSEHLEHIATRSLGMTALMIFAKPQFKQRMQWIQSAGAGVGFWNMGNKGAVAMRIGLSCPGFDDTLDLSFTAAHLAPSESNVDARNKDWENIVKNLVFVRGDDSFFSSSEESPLLSSAEPPRDHSGLFTAGNHVFFYGDLNYRTHDTGPEPGSHKFFPRSSASEASPRHYSRLLEKDQLTREREANRTLHSLQELPVRFPPTYKYAVSDDKSASARQRLVSDDEEEWKWSKHRYPSWCDRILFLPSHPSSQLDPQIYTALPVQSTSDHRPVALSLRVEDKPIPRDGKDIRSLPPFPINPQWKTRQVAARRWEVIVGVLSYLTLTSKGKAILIVFFGLVLGSFWLAAWVRT